MVSSVGKSHSDQCIMSYSGSYIITLNKNLDSDISCPNHYSLHKDLRILTCSHKFELLSQDSFISTSSENLEGIMFAINA